MVIFRKKRTTKQSSVIKGRSSRRKKRVLLAKRAGNKLRSRFSLAVFMLLFVISGITYYFFVSEQFLIESISIEGISESLAKEVRLHIEDSLNSKKFILLKQNKTLLFPREQFLVRIEQLIPRLKDAEIKIELPHSLQFKATERIQEGIWCNYTNLSLPKCYFYDTEGVVYENAPSSAKGSLILLIRDKRFEFVIMPQEVLNEEFFAYINELFEFLEIGYQKPEYISIEDSNEIRIGFSEGWEAYMLRSNSSTEQIENLVLIVNEKIGDRVHELEYIDLRLGNKVFFKYK